LNDGGPATGEVHEADASDITVNGNENIKKETDEQEKQRDRFTMWNLQRELAEKRQAHADNKLARIFYV
jgi:hypothetical protein